MLRLETGKTVTAEVVKVLNADRRTVDLKEDVGGKFSRIIQDIPYHPNACSSWFWPHEVESNQQPTLPKTEPTRPQIRRTRPPKMDENLPVWGFTCSCIDLGHNDSSDRVCFERPDGGWVSIDKMCSKCKGSGHVKD
ncbi:hypothetical protein Sinac_1645 [Singulisphaera acidiphila DSM 18658]|uniref:Uncharacterized protein n=2 Tax=Singulisphaera acidiphila TaxID=466153 RepID=L0DB07_SINAD|nr:hypothetical protein Sinac_1645 [Singulisphaera acidiphila DSM 18658]